MILVAVLFWMYCLAEQPLEEYYSIKRAVEEEDGWR